MEPISVSVAVSAIIASIDWKKLAQSLATDAAKSGFKNTIRRLKPDERERAAKRAVELFTEEFLLELADKAPSSALAGYQDQLRKLIEVAAPEIVFWFAPETKDVDLGSVQRMWTGLALDPLPDFDWSLVAQNYGRAIRKEIRTDDTLRDILLAVVAERQLETQEASVALLQRVAGPAPGFDLDKYRTYLRQKCAFLRLSALHSSAYGRSVGVSPVFVPQSVRESLPPRDRSRNLDAKVEQNSSVTDDFGDTNVARLEDYYARTPLRPVLDIIYDERLLVVLGDPGAGKTTLLKFLVMKWVEEEVSQIDEALPVWIDLKEYAVKREGLVKFCESGCSSYGLDSNDLNRLLASGQGAVYLEGLDEIFDLTTRGLVIEDISAFVTRYTKTKILLTSRIVGYDAEPLLHVGFKHATLENFDDDQIQAFTGKWYDIYEQEASRRPLHKAKLSRALRESRALRDLAGNPLLLTLIAIVNTVGDLPGNRVELYAEASRVLLHDWDAHRFLPVDSFGSREKRELLCEVAGLMQQRQQRLAGNLIESDVLLNQIREFLRNRGVLEFYAKASSLVQQLTERNYILCFAGAEQFSFVHRTFLEYFCAASYVDLFEKKQTLSLQDMKTHVFGEHWRNETWHEILRLIAGMVGEKQAEELILFLMEQDGRSDRWVNLSLAAKCLGEVGNRQAIRATDDLLRQEFVKRVLNYEPPYFYSRYSDEDYSTVRLTRKQAVSVLASVWPTSDTRAWLRSAADGNDFFSVGEQAMRALAHGWKDDPDVRSFVMSWVMKYDYVIPRYAGIEELARNWKNDPEVVAWLKKFVQSGKGCYLPMAAVHELTQARKSEPDALEWVKSCAHHEKNGCVRAGAVRELARGWKNDPETLPILQRICVTAPEYLDGLAALEELAFGWKYDPAIATAVRNAALSNFHTFAYEEILERRSRFWYDNFDLDLRPELRRRDGPDEERNFHEAAVQELARDWRDDSETLPWLKEYIRDGDDSYVQRVAVREVARAWKEDPTIVGWLHSCIQSNENHHVREVAVQELARGWKDHVDTAQVVIRCTQVDDVHWVRAAAVRAYATGWRNDPSTFAWLKQHAVEDPHKSVRESAIHELSRGWNQHVEVRVILNNRAENDPDEEVRKAALRELARAWKDHPSTLDLLKRRAQGDSHKEVRKAAVQELARGWKKDPEVIQLVAGYSSYELEDYS